MKILHRQGTRIKEVLLAVYASLPVLIISLLLYFTVGGNSEPGSYLLTGLYIFTADCFLFFLLLSLLKRLPIIILGTILLAANVFTSIILGQQVHSYYFLLILGLNIKPLLTIAIYLVRKHFPRQSIEQSATFINLGLLLLASYFIVFHLFKISMLLYPAVEIPFSNFLIE